MTSTETSRRNWRKSSRSQAGGTECVEVALAGQWCAVRDSKDPDGVVLTVSASTWRTLHSQIKRGDHDLA